MKSFKQFIVEKRDVQRIVVKDKSTRDNLNKALIKALKATQSKYKPDITGAKELTFDFDRVGSIAFADKATIQDLIDQSAEKRIDAVTGKEIKR
jgi:hypothetical protein